jgi:hypothetical protein
MNVLDRIDKQSPAKTLREMWDIRTGKVKPEYFAAIGMPVSPKDYQEDRKGMTLRLHNDMERLEKLHQAG